MERAVAITKLRKLIGKHLAYRVDPKAPTREERESARSEMTEAIQARQEIEKRRDERRNAILAADAEYQGLVAEHDAARKRTDRLRSIVHRHKITVGTTESGLFFLVKAEGDSWEDVIEKLSRKAA